MFNKSKKYNIVKCLPFICFANINATEKFISKKDQIKVVVNGKTYVLADDTKIIDDNSANIDISDILSLANVWKKGDDEDYESCLPEIKKEEYKLVSYILNGSEGKDETELSIPYKNIKSGLTLNFESVYKLAHGSFLTDGINTIDIKNKEILDSDLRSITNVDDLFPFIKTKFKEDKFGNTGEGCLKGKKGAEIDKDKFFISSFNNSAFNFVDDDINTFKQCIANGEKIILQFSPYLKYTINDIKLSKELAKTRKLKDNLEDVKKIFNDEFSKYKMRISLAGIQAFIEDYEDENFKKIQIDCNGNLKTPEELTSIEVTSDEGNMVSELMKGTIYFFSDSKNLKPLKKGTGSNKFVDKIDFKFGTTNNDFDTALSIDTTTTEDVIKTSINKYLGVEDYSKHSVHFTKGSNGKKVTGDFIIVVELKDIIPNFTAKLDKTDINVQVKFKIDNDDNNYELLGLSDKSFTLQNVNVYSDFVTALKSELINIDNEIKEVKFETTNKIWSSESEKTKQLQTFLTKPGDKSIEVTVTLNKNDNGTYVKKKATPPAEPPAKENVTFKLKLSTLVKDHKIKNNKTEITVTVPKDGLNYSILFNAIQTQIGDDKFKIMKGSSAIKNTDTIDIINKNAYSINLEEGSSLLDKNKKEDDEETRSTEDKENTEQPEKNSNKKCCSGKKGCNCKKN